MLNRNSTLTGFDVNFHWRSRSGEIFTTRAANAAFERR